MLQFDNKEIEEWHGTRRESSMWKEDGVGTLEEIVPEQLRKDHGIWVQASWKGKVFGD